MTTLSKEDVVRWAREAELTVGQHWNRGNRTTAFMTDFATLARADIVEANKALVAENERLKATPPDQRQDLHCVVSDISAECRELRTALATATNLLIDIKASLVIASQDLVGSGRSLDSEISDIDNFLNPQE